jgi:hypothetical protein
LGDRWIDPVLDGLRVPPYHAGTLFGLGEALGGGVFFANFDLRRFTATVTDMQIRYRRPAMTDARAETSLDTKSSASNGKPRPSARPSLCLVRK